ncbi:MAG: glycerol-3-phosphate 1-O-acyltransferase PlsY [Holosporales bacterium]|jgi:glycerol-3-phosphate acyltransferase PlsY|nr:glycerol-3-phosphate 1-O-acyltransferase PlsY [Holosporales bacterium]
MIEGMFLFLVAYLVGAIPFGMVLVYFCGKGDLRKIGSGNIGATNVVRTQGKLLGVFAFLLDAVKGVGVCAVTASTMPALTVWVGLCAVLGHCFSCFLKLQGGKGVATALGIFLFLTPITGLACALIWGIVFSFSRISSLSGLLSIGCAPGVLWGIAWIGGTPIQDFLSTFWAYVCITLIVILKHRTNITRLVQGKELKFTKKCP